MKRLMLTLAAVALLIAIEAQAGGADVLSIVCPVIGLPHHHGFRRALPSRVRMRHHVRCSAPLR